MNQLLDEDEFEESKALKHSSLDQLPIQHGGFQCFKEQVNSNILESNRRLLSVSCTWRSFCIIDKSLDSQ